MNSIHTPLQNQQLMRAISQIIRLKLVLILLAVISFGRTNAQITTVGSETQLNGVSAGDQAYPSAAVNKHGYEVVAWETNGEDSDGYGIKAALYRQNGTVAVAPFIVNIATDGDQRRPAVAIDTSGNFVVTWMDFGLDGNGWGIYRRLFDSTGTGIGSQFRVNNTLAGQQRFPAAYMDEDGDFVIAWESEGDIYRRRINSAGANLESEVLVNSTVAGAQISVDIAGDSLGNHTIVWQSLGQDGDGYGIFAQDYLSSGIADGTEYAVNTTTVGNQIAPAVARSNQGKTVIAWSSYDQDGDNYGIFLQRYNGGVASGSEVQVNTTTTSTQNYVDVASSPAGVEFVVWNGYDQDGDASGIYRRTYLTDGTAFEDETLINTETSKFQVMPSVSVGRENGNLCIVWQSGQYGMTSGTQDGDQYGIFSQKFDVTDLSVPTAVCSDITVYLDAQGMASVTAEDIDNGSSDACGSVTLSTDVSGVSCTDVGNAVTATLTVTNCIGNQQTCTSIITVLDTVSPVAVCQDITVYLDGSGTASITSGDIDNGSSDACGIDVVSISTESFNCGNVGNNAVTLTVSDLNGNMSGCQSTVTVIDSVSPVAVCQDITVYLDNNGLVSVNAGDLDGGSTDNCGLANISASPTVFFCSNTGSNQSMLTATDVNGNNAQCASNVTVLDTVTPTALCQDITIALDPNGQATITGNDVDGGSNDNCDVNLSVSPSSFTCGEVGGNTVTLTVTDPSANFKTCTAVVTVEDIIAPNAVCQDITVYLDGAGNATATAADIDGGSSDICGISGLSIDNGAFTCSNVGSNTVQLTATDVNGLEGMCASNVTVLDSTSPVAVCQDLTVQLDPSGVAMINAGDVNAGSSDNCGLSGLSLNVSSFTCNDLGGNPVVLTVTDNSNNTNSCGATVTIVDATPP